MFGAKTIAGRMTWWHEREYETTNERPLPSDSAVVLVFAIISGARKSLGVPP
jgi:hypothetical protein